MVSGVLRQLSDGASRQRGPRVGARNGVGIRLQARASGRSIRPNVQALAVPKYLLLCALPIQRSWAREVYFKEHQRDEGEGALPVWIRRMCGAEGCRWRRNRTIGPTCKGLTRDRIIFLFFRATNAIFNILFLLI